MNTYLLRGLILALFSLGLYAAPAQAFVYVNAIDWSPALPVSDQQSGNQSNFSYGHTLDAALLGKTPLSAKLSLTHFANSNVGGSSSEIWSLFAENGTQVGTLSESLASKVSETWNIPAAVLAYLVQGGSTNWGFYLSEQTTFNGEKIDLHRSLLEVEYEDPKQEIPKEEEPSSPSAVPEPASALLVGLGAAGSFLTQRQSRR